MTRFDGKNEILTIVYPIGELVGHFMHSSPEKFAFMLVS